MIGGSQLNLILEDVAKCSGLGFTRTPPDPKRELVQVSQSNLAFDSAIHIVTAASHGRHSEDRCYYRFEVPALC